MQVYVEDHLVGQLTRHVHESVRAITLQFLRDPLKMFYDEHERIEDPVIQQVTFDIKMRAVSLQVDRWASEGEQAAMIQHSRRRFNIPDDVEPFWDHNLFTGDLVAKFKWRAIQVDQDTYEEHLFDHHEFEPV